MRHNKPTRDALALVIGRAYYFDKLNVLFTSFEPAIDLVTVTKHCGSNPSVIPTPMRRGLYKSKLQLFRPKPPALRAVCTVPGERTVGKVEIALDLITKTMKDAEALRDYFVQYLVKPKSRQKVIFSKEGEGSNAYWARRKSPSNITVYARLSKGAGRYHGQPCCHVEYRYSASESLEQVGVVTLDDLVTFDHQSFWRKKLALRTVSAESFGAQLIAHQGEDSKTTSRQYLSQLAKKRFEASHSGVEVCTSFQQSAGKRPVMQNLYLDYPWLSQVWIVIDNKKFVG